MESGTKLNSTLIKAFEIIQLIADHQGELGLDGICKRLNMNKTTVFRHIETLVYMNLLEKREGSYFLGIGLFEMGSKVRIQNLIIERIHLIFEKLAKDVNETVNFAQIFDDTALYLYNAESRRSLQLRVSIGAKLPLYCTALGKAILSILDTERLDSLIANLKMKKMTQYTVTDPVELMKKIDSVRDRGYSIDREEFDDGLVCVAVPIKISELGFIGGISISGPINRFDDERGHFLAQKLLETSNEILDTLHHELGGFNDRGKMAR